MQQGGALVFPLPTFEVVEQETQEAYPATAQDRKIA
jgi:hypothetical protein